MKKSIDFSKYLSIKIGAPILVDVIEDYSYDKSLKILGHGCNLLVSPDAHSLAVLGDRFDYIKDLGNLIEVGGACNSAKIFKFFKQNNLSGLEFLRALPGSLGGLVKMNAGMKHYEIKNILHSVCVDSEWIEAEKLGLTYRKTDINGVIFAARFKKEYGFRQEVEEMCTLMRKTHPKKPSCGSCFKNPEGDFAGRLLEAVGLRGYSYCGVGFSEAHANFLVNYDRNLAGYDSALEIIRLGEKRVYEEFGIKLEKEVIIIE